MFGWGVPELISPARFGGVVEQIQPRYDAAASLAATASLVRACSNIITEAIEGGRAAQASRGKQWNLPGRGPLRASR